MPKEYILLEVIERKNGKNIEKNSIIHSLKETLDGYFFILKNDDKDYFVKKLPLIIENSSENRLLMECYNKLIEEANILKNKMKIITKL